MGEDASLFPRHRLRRHLRVPHCVHTQTLKVAGVPARMDSLTCPAHQSADAVMTLVANGYGLVAGIPARDRERIFSPFQRLGGTDNISGLGIGLALSRGLVEAMGGTLQATDTPNGGLTMVLALPAAHETAATQLPETPPTAPPGTPLGVDP